MPGIRKLVSGMDRKIEKRPTIWSLDMETREQRNSSGNRCASSHPWDRFWIPLKIISARLPASHKIEGIEGVLAGYSVNGGKIVD